MRDTFEVTRQKYLQQAQFHKFGVLSISSMKKYRPARILLYHDTPFYQCLCDKCENCEQLIRALHAIGLQNLPGNRYAIVDSVVCTHRRHQVGSDFSFTKMSCLNETCEEHGEGILQKIIDESNEMLRENRHISWQKWMSKLGKSAPDKCQVRGTLQQAIAEMLQIVKPLKSQFFGANWNHNIFEYMRRNLRPGYLLQILDFAMNFKNIVGVQGQWVMPPQVGNNRSKPKCGLFSKTNFSCCSTFYTNVNYVPCFIEIRIFPGGITVLVVIGGHFVKLPACISLVLQRARGILTKVQQ